MSERLQELAAAGVSIWLDDLDRDLITSGGLQSLIDDSSVTGVTTNPAIFNKAISGDAGVFDVAAAIQHDVSDIDGIAGQHVSLPARVEVGGAGVTIATGDHFVDDAETVAEIQRLGASLVDMETYAYIWVAQQYGVPIRVLKAVSDRAQDDAITDWRAAVAACSVELRDRVRELYGV